MKQSKFKSTHRILRAFLARFLCLCHIALSIFVLWSVKKDFLYLFPIIGAVLLVAETGIILTIFRGKEPTKWFSSAFFIYVSTIVPCYWFLELENIRKIISGLMIRDYKITIDQLMGDIVSNIKIIWSQVQLQIFFALIMFIRWLIPKSRLTPHGLSELLFKYFAISCDMLDFLSILQDTTLIKNQQLVYWTLSAWSWSTIQFFIFVPKYEDVEKNEFTAYITNSLLSVLLLDLPYFGIRMAAIFAFGSHNYNSYFFATKNMVLILLQIFRIKATFSERKIREDKQARTLKDKIGFDQESNKLFHPYEIAKRNFVAERLRNMQNSSGDSLDEIEHNAFTDLENKSSNDSIDNLSPNRRIRLPRTIETVKYNKKVGYDQRSENGSIENLDRRAYQNEERVNQRPGYIPAVVPRTVTKDVKYSRDSQNRSLYTPNVGAYQNNNKHTDV